MNITEAHTEIQRINRSFDTYLWFNK